MAARIGDLIGRDEARRAIHTLADDQLCEAWVHLLNEPLHEPLAQRVLDAIRYELEQRRIQPPPVRRAA